MYFSFTVAFEDQAKDLSDSAADTDRQNCISPQRAHRCHVYQRGIRSKSAGKWQTESRELPPWVKKMQDRCCKFGLQRVFTTTLDEHFSALVLLWRSFESHTSYAFIMGDGTKLPNPGLHITSLEAQETTYQLLKPHRGEVHRTRCIKVSSRRERRVESALTGDVPSPTHSYAVLGVKLQVYIC